MLCRRIERAIISNIVKDAFRASRAAAYDGGQSRERIGRLGSARLEVIDAVVAQFRQMGTIGLAAIHSGDAFRAIEIVHRVHSVDADQQYVANAMALSR